jgi:hypothetical protein
MFYIINLIWLIGLNFNLKKIVIIELVIILTRCWHLDVLDVFEIMIWHVIKEYGQLFTIIL